MTEDLLSIGRLARLSGLTVKVLRYYDRTGVMRPVVVDELTGFRYYGLGQVNEARLIRRLRSLDVPLDDVRRCISTPRSRATVEEVIRTHQRRLESRAARIAGDLHRISHFFGEEAEETMTTQPATDDVIDHEGERRLAGQLFNGVWLLLEKEDRTEDDDDRMLHMAHASRYHWGEVGSAENIARGEWQCSRVYAVLRRAEPSLHHAQRVLQVCQAGGLGDFDLAFAYEALARAHAVGGDKEQARSMIERAVAATEEISDDEDRRIVLADLETIPDQDRFW